MQQITTSSTRFMHMLKNIDVRKSACFKPDDLLQIFSVVETIDGKFDAVNALVRGKLRDWLRSYILQQVRAPGKTHLEQAQLLYAIGHMMWDLEDHDAAIAHFDEVLAFDRHEMFTTFGKHCQRENGTLCGPSLRAASLRLKSKIYLNGKKDLGAALDCLYAILADDDASLCFRHLRLQESNTAATAATATTATTAAATLPAEATATTTAEGMPDSSVDSADVLLAFSMNFPDRVKCAVACLLPDEGESLESIGIARANTGSYMDNYAWELTQKHLYDEIAEIWHLQERKDDLERMNAFRLRALQPRQLSKITRLKEKRGVRNTDKFTYIDSDDVRTLMDLHLTIARQYNTQGNACYNANAAFLHYKSVLKIRTSEQYDAKYCEERRLKARNIAHEIMANQGLSWDSEDEYGSDDSSGEWSTTDEVAGGDTTTNDSN
jgi:hypothetical protein